MQQQPFVMNEGLLSIIPAGCLRADDLPPLINRKKKTKKKNVVKVGLSASAHDQALSYGQSSVHVSTPVKQSNLISMTIV